MPKSEAMYNYFALALIATVGIVFLDDNPDSVSVQDWILYAVLIFAAIGFLRKYLDIISRQNR